MASVEIGFYVSGGARRHLVFGDVGVSSNEGAEFRTVACETPAAAG